MKLKTLAIPIRCVDFSDSSQVVSLFTRELGLVEGIAKGAHRDKSPFQGPFDLAVLYELVFIERQQEGLAILTESTVIDGFRGVRRSWQRHVAATHVIEFLRAVVSPAEPERNLFELTARTLRLLASPEAPPTGPLLLAYDTRALAELGFLGPLTACVECGRERPPEPRPVFLSPRSRGILCRFCREESPDPLGVTLSGPAVALLERLAGDSPEPWNGVDDQWRAVGKPLVRAVSRLRTNLLERELVLLKSAGSWLSNP